jgi:predicted ATPase
MIEPHVFTLLWNQLRGRKPQMQQYLNSVSLRGFRGIEDLTVDFSYPVTVLAGRNGCGKSTVLFAAGCAYDTEQMLSPAKLFPNFIPTSVRLSPLEEQLKPSLIAFEKTLLKPKRRPLVPSASTLSDVQLANLNSPSEFEYFYRDHNRSANMVWKRRGAGSQWSRSFLGRKDATQPKRIVYTHTLSKLASPNEVRGMLALGNRECTIEEIDSDLIAFAQNVLGFDYQSVSAIRSKSTKKDLLFATREGNPEAPLKYSEFHMSAGERALLRLSQDISRLKNALILIDEVESGLHPLTQQHLMLQLQRIALRNDLQIILTTHSPVVLECVPMEARVFLERTENGKVAAHPAYKDVFQRALYGQSRHVLSVLCEDEIATYLVYGVFDTLSKELNIAPDQIQINHDTGKDEFKHHIDILGRNKLLDSFVFILDGDGRDLEEPLRKRADETFRKSISLLFLPEDEAPEEWIYKRIEENTNEYAEKLGLRGHVLASALRDQRIVYAAATDRPSNVSKNRFESVCTVINRTTRDIARLVARTEVEKGLLASPIYRFKDQFKDAIERWRQRHDYF